MYLEDELNHIDYELSKLAKKKNKLFSKKIPPVCVFKRKNHFVYYLVDNNGKKKYVKKQDYDKLKSIFQTGYEQNLYKKLVESRKIIKRFLDKYEENSIRNVYEELSEGRKRFINPVVESDEDFVRKWYQMYPDHMNTFDVLPSYVTSNGEKVRSKTEVIIADLFTSMSIPYSYETEFVTEDGKRYYPDFVLLNKRTRKTYVWEHLGLITNEDYASKNFLKLCEYEKSNLKFGENFIISMESDKYPLDIELIKEKIRRYLI